MIKIVILHPQGYDLMYKWNNRETLGGNKKIYIKKWFQITYCGWDVKLFV